MNKETKRFIGFIHEEAKRNRKEPDAYFVDWYAQIRKQHSSSRCYSFPNGDGGVDLVIFHDLSLLLAQLKFCKASKEQLRAFESPIRAWEKEKTFNEWLAKGVKNKYAKKIFQEAYDEHKRRKLFLNWEFVSLNAENEDWNSILRSFCLPGKSNVQMVSMNDLLYYFALEQTGASYTDPIEFEVPTGNMAVRHANGFRTLAFCVEMNEIISGVKRHGKLETLLARNVRLEIPGSVVNKDIRETARKTPDKFFFGNNGIHIVTTRADQPGGKLRLEQPAIINGGQTIKQLMSAHPKHNKGQVLLRVTEIPKEFQACEAGRQFVGDIIFMSNNNNKMEPWNLRSNDPEQIIIAKYLHLNKIFYERKDFEWKESRDRIENADMVSYIDSTDLASAYCCIRRDIGPAKLKMMGIGPLFDRRSDYYDLIFKALSERLEDALSLARLYLIVGQWSNHPVGVPFDFKGFGRASSNFVFSMIWEALHSNGRFLKPFMLIPSKTYKNACPHLGRIVQKIIKELFVEFKTDMKSRGIQQNDIFRGAEYWERARRKILTRKWKKEIEKSALKDWQH